jgi:hypothetical protein
VRFPLGVLLFIAAVCCTLIHGLAGNAIANDLKSHNLYTSFSERGFHNLDAMFRDHRQLFPRSRARVLYLGAICGAAGCFLGIIIAWLF